MEILEVRKRIQTIAGVLWSGRCQIDGHTGIGGVEAHRIGPGTAIKNVVARAAVDNVVAAGAAEMVVVGATEEIVVEGRADHAFDRVEIVAPRPDRVLHEVFRPQADRHPRRGCGVGHRVKTRAPKYVVLAKATGQHVVAIVAA